MPAAGEVLVQLAADVVERAAGAQHARAEVAGELVERGVGRKAIRQRPRSVDGDEQVADRRVGDVVGDVDETSRSRGLAEARVEIGGDRHACSFQQRMRRTPDEAAWRAASSDEPSAAPIAA